MKRRWAAILSLSVLLLLGCVSCGLLICGFQREQADQALILALKANQTEKALDALEARANPNIRDSGEAPPSFRRYLVTLWRQMQGIKPPAPEVGVTALALAIQQNNSVLVDALLARGAKNIGDRVQVQDKWGEGFLSLTLLMAAAKNKNPGIVQTLIQHGWQVDEISGYHETALFYAGDAATIKMLVVHGANINAKNEFQWTPLDDRIRDRDNETFDALLDLGAQDTKAIGIAIYFDQTSALKKLIRKRWDLNMLDNEGATPLTCALSSGSMLRPDMALILIQSGADVNQPDKQRNFPLALAADGGRYPEMDTQSPILIKALLAHGARVNKHEEEN